MDNDQFDEASTLAAAGDALVANGDLANAITSYRASLGVWRALLRSMPDNADWKRQFALTYFKTGEAQEMQRDFLGALASFRSGLAVAERLTTTSFGDAQSHHILSLYYMKVGEMQTAQGNPPDALQAYRAGVAILERLAAIELGEIGDQKYLMKGYGEIGRILFHEGDLDGAVENLKLSLIGANPNIEDDVPSINVAHFLIGAALMAKGDAKSAKDNYEISRVLTERVPKEQMHFQYKVNYSLLLEHIGDALSAIGSDQAALKTFGEALAILDELVAIEPGLSDARLKLQEKIGKASVA